MKPNLLVSLLVLGSAGCPPGDSGTNDGGDQASPAQVDASGSSSPDFAAADFAVADFAVADFALPDLAKPDLGVRPHKALSFLARLTGGPGVPVGGGAYAIADFNNDGKPDVLLGGTVYLALGGGRFMQVTNGGACGYDSAPAIGDLNGDGKVDVVCAWSQGNVVSVLLNTSNGVLAAPVNYTVTDPVSVAVGDLDGDGKADIIVSVLTTRSVSVLHNLGGGSFAAAAVVTGGAGTGGGKLFAADLNGDQKIDLAVVNPPAAKGGMYNINFLVNQGSGTFGAPNNMYQGFNAPLAVAMGDLNGDGKPDLAFGEGCACSGSFILAFNKGDGTMGGGAFVGFGFQTPIGAAGNVSAIGIGDIDGDGKQDLVVSSAAWPAGGLSVLLNQGNSKFGTSVNYMVDGPYSGVAPFAIVDLNDDGKPDVLGPGILYNLGGGVLADAANYLHASTLARQAALGDLNGDGKLDIATIDDNVGQAWLINQGNGTFTPTTGFGGFTGGTNIQGQRGAVAIGDLFGNGKGVVVIADSYQKLVLANGSFPFRSPSMVVTGDVDSDGLVDVLVGDLTGYNLLHNMGGGVMTVAYKGASNGGSLLADLDGDGRLDAIGGSSVSLNIGGGKFGPPTQLAYPGATLAVGDINGDGALDLVGDNGVLINSGHGTFGALQAKAFGGHVALGDFDGDGVPDVASVQSYGVTVFLNLGNGAFAAPVYYATNVLPGTNGVDSNANILAGDLNGDGLADLVTISPSGGVSVLLNNSH